MNELNIGSMILREQGRDAIHVAVAPVVARELLSPGDKVALFGDLEMVGLSDRPIGVIDPFLTRKVQPGERCWMFLNPGSIKSLHHVWTHPAFDQPLGASTLDAVRWLESYAAEMGLSYEQLMSGARDYLENGSYIVNHAWEGLDIDSHFWGYYQIATGTNVPAKNQGSFFSCGGCS